MDFSIFKSKDAKLYNPASRPTKVGDAFGELKKMLISRDPAAQLNAVSFIKKMIIQCGHAKRRKYIIVAVIENEICTFLCEAMATFILPLLREILHCFELLMSERLFYAESNASDVISSIVRTIHYWTRENTSTDAISYALGFLTRFFIRLKEYGFPPFLASNSSYNSVQMLKLITAVFENAAIGEKTKIVACFTLRAIVSHLPPSLKIDKGNCQSCFVCISAALQFLHALLFEVSNKLEEKDDDAFVFGFICQLGADCLRLCGIKDTKETDDEEHLNAQIDMRQVKNMVYESMKILNTHVKAFYAELSSSDFQLFLVLLNKFFHDKSYQKSLPAFTMNLVECGFLAILPKLKFSSKEQKLRWLSDINLAEILVVMSRNFLNIETWPGGEAEFSKLIHYGLSKLESDYTLSLKSIGSIVSDRAAANTIMVFLYFKCLTSGRCENPSPLPFLVNYILKLPPSFSFPQSIYKCICFIFAISNLSYMKDLELEDRMAREKAILKFFHALSPNLEECYTHHPALLLWVFSSASIPADARATFVSKWLENEDALPQGVSTITDLWWTLLDVIQMSGDSKVVLLAANLLEECLKTDCDPLVEAEIVSQLWEMLPNELIKLHIHSSSTEKTDKIEAILALTTSTVPATIFLTMIQRLASLLTAVHPDLYEAHQLKNAKLSFLIIKQGYYLLLLAIQKRDVSVPSIMINKGFYIQSLLKAVESVNKEISCISLQFLSYLCFYQNKHSLKVSHTFELEPTMLVSFLCKEETQNKILPLLQLVYMILCSVNHTRAPLMMIKCKESESSSIDAFQLLYYRLQNVCCHKSPKQSESGWRCLTPILQYTIESQDSPRLISLLTLQPWNHMLIRFYLQQAPVHNISLQFLSFLSAWLRCLKVIRKDEKIVLVRNERHELISLQRMDILNDTLSRIIRAFDGEAELDKVSSEKKEAIISILTLISQFFTIQQ